MKLLCKTGWIPALAGMTMLASAAFAQSAADFNNRGIEAYNKSQFKEAVQLFERAYQGASDNEAVRHNLCNAHQAVANQLAINEKFREAVHELEIAIGIEPNNASPLVQLGSYYLRLDNVQQAIFRLEEAIQLAPTNLDGHELLGEAYYRDNDIASARVQWDYVLEQDPKRTVLRQRYEKAFREESVEYDFKKSGSRHFKITYPREVSATTKSYVLNILERAYMDIGRKFGGVYPPPPIQVVVYDADRFTEATKLASHVGAVFDGKIRAPLTDEKGEPLPAEEMRRRLTHEYAHVVIRHMAGSSVPWWLNEGLAEAVSRNMDDADTRALQRIFSLNTALKLSQMERSQLEHLDAERLRSAYSQALATVNLLLTRYGQRRINQLLQDIATGAKPEEALQKAFRRNYASLDEEVAQAYRAG